MQLIFWGMTWKDILSYLDDLNVLGTSFEDHLANLRKSFECIRQYGLKLKPRKCCLFQTEVPFLGKLVSREGIAVDPKKTKAVMDWLIPKSWRDVETFLVFINYHQYYIKDFAEIASCLYELTGPKSHFKWTPVYQEAFEKLWDRLVCAPVLAYPNTKDQFILDTDASDKAIGAELIQVQNGEEKVISYQSHFLLQVNETMFFFCKVDS